MSGALLFSRADVERLLTPEACIAALEDALRQLALRGVPAPGVLGLHAAEGSFHLKAGFLATDRAYFAAKINANFPRNGPRHGLPTIQGAVMLFDAGNGTPLAIMDSISITALRTAAASAIAAKHLAVQRCGTALVCGCGQQARAQLQALRTVRRPQRILVYDLDVARAEALAGESDAAVTVAKDLAEAVAASRIIVTCTTARRFFIAREMVQPGTFIAAVGADNEDKQEVDPLLLAHAKVVTDLTEQAATIGDLHHAIAADVMAREDVHAELAEIVAGRKPGRAGDDEIIVYDSTGTGLQDVAAAVAVYREARKQGCGSGFSLG
jgi:ornithine cyclodeaminase/alanine dehydrogenase-like protein (mu-crystallin family)